jgi:hypothetical protein
MPALLDEVVTYRCDYCLEETSAEFTRWLQRGATNYAVCTLCASAAGSRRRGRLKPGEKMALKDYPHLRERRA